MRQRHQRSTTRPVASKWAGFWICLAWVIGGAVGVVRGQESGMDGIWHVRLRFTAAGVEWIGAVRTAGVLKPGLAHGGGIGVELLQADGTGVGAVTLPDPRLRRWEYETAPGSGELTTLPVERSDAEVEVRLPDHPEGRRVGVYRGNPRGSGPALHAADGERVLLGEYELPNREAARWRRSTVLADEPVGITMLTNGPSKRRLNIVFLSEGYRTTELAAFTNHARLVLDLFLASPPFSAYRSHINAQAAFVPSRESGSDHPSRGIVRDTYFQTTYDTSGIAYLLTFTGDGIARAQQAARTVEPEYDIVVAIANDAEYGGSGGPVLLTSAHQDSARIAIHELGHTFAGLADEYETLYPGYPVFDEPNTTTQTARDQVKWRAWVLEGTPLPTPPVAANASVVGLFEGARYQSKGWYRPRLNCLMRTLGEPYCEICREAMTLRLYQVLRPVDGTDPDHRVPLEFSATGAPRLTVRSLQPTVGAMRYEWRINGGLPRSEASASLALLPADLPFPTNRVVVRVSDPTTWVRNDPKSLMSEEVEWTLVRAPLPPRPSAAMGADGQVAIFWPASANANLVLETTTRVPGSSWNSATNAVVIEGTHRVVRVRPTGTGAFYRLRGP